MTTEEFSIGFDILVDSYRRFKAFDDKLNLDSIEFNEYEKSWYLTYAQEQLVQGLYSGTSPLASFEKNEEARRYLDSLVKQAVFPSEEFPQESDSYTVLTDKFVHTPFQLPKDCWYIVYEQGVFGDNAGKCMAGVSADVVPVTHDEYFRTIQNPFRGPNRKRILRLDSGHLQVELVSTASVGQYIVRYLAHPEPIVLTSLKEDGLKIGHTDQPQTCKLPELLHKAVLEKAVTIALQQKTTNTNKDNASK